MIVKFAKTIDIHRKPGYDPLELFLDYETKSISQDTNLIRSSHGLLPEPHSDEGHALYISNRRMMESNGESGQGITSADVGRHLISLLAG